jgi:hypothetical protein
MRATRSINWYCCYAYLSLHTTITSKLPPNLQPAAELAALILSLRSPLTSLIQYNAGSQGFVDGTPSAMRSIERATAY